MTPFIRNSRRLVAVICAVLGTCAVARAQSAVDGFDPGANSSVYALAVQPDGKILVGGNFTTLGGGGTGTTARHRLGRLNADGSLDTSFNPGATPFFIVYALAVQPDGKILVGGSSSALDGVTLERFNADGSLDASFNPVAASSAVLALVVQPDGKILVGGHFTRLGAGGTGTTARNFLVRLNADGSLDTTFNPGANAFVAALAVQPDGKILVGGGFTTLGGGGTGTTARNFLGRLNADGSLDTTFDPVANSSVRAFAVQPDRKILVGGDFTTLGGGGTFRYLGRFNADGSLDTSFDPGAGGYVRTLVVQPDGKILVGGAFASLGGGGFGMTTRNSLGRLNADGSLDTTFNPGANAFVAALAVQPDGKILVGGAFTTLGGGGTGKTARNRLGRLLTVSTTTPTMALDRTSLVFSATRTGTAFASQTGSQTVRLTQSGAGAAVTWTATSNTPWLTVTPASGSGSTALSLAVKFDASLPASGNVTGAITLALTGAANTVGPINVTLTVVPSTAAASPPFGSFDTPAGDATVLAGSIALTGWTLDNIGVKQVELWRDLQPGETTPPGNTTPGDPRNGKIFIAFGTFVDNARPDVEGLYPAIPANYRAGWGYLMLTWGLFGQGNGTYKFYAFGVDQEGNSATIGTKTAIISNNTATKPFGSIDTPAIGGDASGPNFGWGLTPKVNGVATCKIQPSGVQVSIDSGPLQPVVYGADVRGDIAGAFTGFSNSAAAGGHYIFDWSTLRNGAHTIGWLITDDCNRADGVGSRFFNVTTGTSLTAADASFAVAAPLSLAAASLPSETESDAPITVARGYGELPAIVTPGEAGSRTVDVPQGERIEIRLPHGFATAYQLAPDGERRTLPIGATWDGSSETFYWQPAAGFLGRYRIVFSNGTERISVRVVVVP